MQKGGLASGEQALEFEVDLKIGGNLSKLTSKK
jgi:hypothetical protein